ncbi:hypothetical protein CDAR_538981 [Caerostris darwini]|uniref:Uncharacterized protein n=1 Tax=Caerostris darwini TaxID=1538125 RepID=A0AAV4T2C6_9ARAC|nr:hypothetical protein CDAR_538981 [Caerostris darwini]
MQRGGGGVRGAKKLLELRIIIFPNDIRVATLLLFEFLEQSLTFDSSMDHCLRCLLQRRTKQSEVRNESAITRPTSYPLRSRNDKHFITAKEIK